jgi:hypothetical protein
MQSMFLDLLYRVLKRRIVAWFANIFQVNFSNLPFMSAATRMRSPLSRIRAHQVPS